MNQETLHIQFEKLTDLIVGTLSERETAEINEHLAVCKECSKLKMRAENAIFAMQTDKLEEVPSHILERTFDLFNEIKPQSKPTEKPSFLKKITAVFTDEGLTPAFGLRSGQAESSRRMWLTADSAEIDLRLEKTGETWKVAGQVFGDFTSGGESILQSGESVFKTDLSEDFEFSFKEIPAGNYRLLLYIEQFEIEIPSLSVE